MPRLLLVLAVAASLFMPVPSAQAVGPTSSPPNVLAVSAGYWGTCAIRTDSTLGCWGNAPAPPAGTFTAVSTGDGTACGIRTDGTLSCWGALPDEEAEPDGTFIAVSVGEGHACALRTDGTLACWGSWAGTRPAGTFIAVSAGWAESCAIRSDDGTLACWGAGGEEEMTPPTGTFTAVSLGWGYACALRTDGSVICWAQYEDDAQPAGTFTAVSAGWGYGCAIRTDGTLACGADWEWSAPLPGTFIAVSTGAEHGCAIGTDGTLACWGADDAGQVTPRPTAAFKALPTWLATATVPLTWNARPALAALTSFDVRYRRAKWNGTFEPRVTWLTETTATGQTFTASPGYTYCFNVQAHDADGVMSSWTPDTCTAVPLDDRWLARSSGWTAGTGSSYYRSTYLRSSRYGAMLTRTGVMAKRIAIVATTCPTCGTVRVYWGTSVLKTVSLRSVTTVSGKLITVAGFSSVRSGTLKIKVVSSGKKVIIDGVAIRRN